MMYGRRKTDRPPAEPHPALGSLIVELALIAALIVFLALTATRAATAGTITLHATAHDALRGTIQYDEALDRIQYAGASPYVLTLHTTGGETLTATLTRPGDLVHYYCSAPYRCRLDGQFTTWVDGRVFAAGFEP